MTSEEYKKLSLKEFDRAAEKFDDDDPSVYNMCRRDYPDVLAEAVKEPFTDLLDAGCGTGAMLGMFKRYYPDRNYTGVDLSRKMIETANKKKMEGIHFVAGDCENLPFADNSFDVVTCSMSFHHYPNPEKFFVSLHRVLRPGGRFILRDMASGSRLMMWFINHMTAGDILKTDWMGDIPKENIVIVIAEGLLMYFSKEQVTTILNNITGSFDRGFLFAELMHPKMMKEKMHDTVKHTNAKFGWGTRTGKELSGLNPKLELIKENSFWDEMKKYTLAGKIGSVLAKDLNNRLAVYKWNKW